MANDIRRIIETTTNCIGKKAHIGVVQIAYPNFNVLPFNRIDWRLSFVARNTFRSEWDNVRMEREKGEEGECELSRIPSNATAYKKPCRDLMKIILKWVRAR